MEQKHYSYPSINQFRELIYQVNHRANYVGNDENGDPIYDPSLKKPTLEFVGSNKLHGTNASFIFNIEDNDVQIQSRENIISVEKDNAGYARFITPIMNEIISLVKKNIETRTIDISSFDKIGVYGEWCGGNIQKSVALNGLEKMFVIFDIKLINSTTNENQWLPNDFIMDIKIHDKYIYNIYDFPTWNISIDFTFPQLAQNKLVELTTEVEKNCPTGNVFANEVWKNNTAIQDENGNISFLKENKFTDLIKKDFEKLFIELRKEGYTDKIFIDFSRF